MEVVNTVAELRESRGSLLRRRWSGLGRRPTVGLVPTMGNLHNGHASLLTRMAGECDVRIASIYVNPRQFDDAEDLSKYPRSLDKDLSLCESEGVDLAFVPNDNDLYPGGFETTVCAGAMGGLWEGEVRPGHFDGVLTVVAKLFNICGPDRAYLGEKDYQQLRLVRQMASDLDFEIDVVPCPIVRDSEGQALSSRNARLSPQQKQFAVRISQALHTVQDGYNSGERDTQMLLALGGHVLEGWEQNDLKVDYFQIVNPDTLEARQTAQDGDRVIIGLRLGETRLIDNMAL